MFSTTNFHGRAPRDFASSSGSEQMTTEPTHTYGGILDLVLTDVPDLVWVRFDSPLGTLDHSAVLWMVYWNNLFLTW